MYSESQLAVPPAPPLSDTDGERFTVLIRLLEEVERDEEKSPAEITRMPAEQSKPTLRPFAHD
jgi:hypothetical protein